MNKMFINHKTKRTIACSSKLLDIYNRIFNSNYSTLHKFEIQGKCHKNSLSRLDIIKQCNLRYFHATNCVNGPIVKLTQNEINDILRANEFVHEFNTPGPVRSYETNQLASNSPIEDARAEGMCALTSGLLFGVFDGHAGSACAQVLSKRLYNYIAAYLLSPDLLDQYIKSLSQSDTNAKLITFLNDNVQFVDDIREVYRQSFHKFVSELNENDIPEVLKIPEMLENAFLRLDNDLSREALPLNGNVNMKTLSVAMSGAVTCTAYIDGPHLYIANVGDCNAVLGYVNENNMWEANKLTTEHNSNNQKEVDRITSEHPYNESETVIKMERLLGQLAPLRAMGDFRYKWNKDVMKQVAVKYFGENVMPPNYHTPPYLSAKPEIIYHRLTHHDKFLILATDGLWDIISPLQAIRLVGEHMSGKVTLSPLKLPKKKMRLGDINDMLIQRKESLKMKPLDRNAATHLIRNALGGTDYGIDNAKLSQLLCLPDDVVRVFRDDITITVIYFDSEYIRQCPS